MDPEQEPATESPVTPSAAPAPAAGSPGRLPPGISSGTLWDIARHRGVIRMRLVGGWARGDAAPTAPIEIIVGYQRRASQMDVIRLQMEFEGATGRRFVLREESTVSLADREILRREARLL